MPKFSEMGEYQKVFRDAEIEEYNLKNAKWNTTISLLSLVVSIIALLVSFFK